LPYWLKIPEENVEKTVTWLESLEGENIPERFWKYSVRSGDTLSEIARSSGISLSELLSYNSHVRNGLLRIGERLYLPGNETRPEGADDDKLPDWNGRYIVIPGDTFWSIARVYGIRPEKLAEANYRPLTGILLAGSVLHVPEEEEEGL
ncbi:MAG: LysM peptidoglycan-binding domain-containing protein, partial [Spirochaetaceae bacterium]|nr:LysM peptidoglycan-binding domain-containing protein [Spirochaetaceae bacterium]